MKKHALIVLTALACAGAQGCDDTKPLRRLAPGIEASPSGLEFGEVPLGGFKDLPLTVRDPGELTLIVCGASPSEGATADEACTMVSRVEPSDAPFAPAFGAVTEQGSWLVEAGQARELLVRFTPKVVGPISGALQIFHNVEARPTTVALNGSGVRAEVELSPTSLDFGDVTVGEKKSLEVTITNRANFAQGVSVGPLTQFALVFGVSDAAGMDPPNGEPLRFELGPSAAVTVQVWFSPLEEGEVTNKLPIAVCAASGCRQEVALRGVGLKPALAVSPPSLDFGALESGLSSSKRFEAKNVGQSPVLVRSVELEVPSASYVLNPDQALPLSLAPGQTLGVGVRFDSGSPGTKPARVVVRSSAWDNPATADAENAAVVTLQGISIGADIAALPAALSFGTLAIGNGMASRALTLVNQGNAPLTIRQIQLNGPSSEIELIRVPTLPLTLAGGAQTQVLLRYRPQDAGPDEAQLVVRSTDPDSDPLVVPVRGTGGTPTGCALTVSPLALQFGVVERGRVATLPVVVSDTGAAPCSLSNVRVAGDAAYRSLNAADVVLMPGTSARFDITYTPTESADAYGSLELDSDDASQPAVRVPLAGSSVVGALHALPSEVDFSVIPPGCGSPTRAVMLYNTGATAVTVLRAYLDLSTSSEYELSPAPIPSSIPAGGELRLELRYRPRDVGEDLGALFIEHTDSLFPLMIPLRGRSDFAPTLTDRFTQLPAPTVDVLFVVDNSGSMAEEQANLGANFGAFLTYAESTGVDYQIAVTTTDVDVLGARGHFSRQGGSSIITPRTPDAARVFLGNTNVGTNGSSSEQGLEAAFLALSEPLISTSNRSFVRPDASLAVIVVSDEEDQSSRTPAFYESFFWNIKGLHNRSQFSFSAIVVPSANDPLCGSFGPSPGARYIEVAQATGGVVESICTANWGATLQNIGLGTFGLRSRFTLAAQAIPTSIVVTVDGVPMSSGGGAQWTYDPATNSVAFRPGFAPIAGAVVEVSYQVACLP